ncbi:MAG: hypothetical protein E7Z91_07405 [Cyanobacteria bacterium SIG30]|nr:hypothetical protein [Cyanobacteria bacterium SIG30]
MRKNQIILTNDKNGLVTKAFAKQARIFGTPEYRMWQDFLKDFPNAKMVVKKAKRKSTQNGFTNLTYENMIEHISGLENADELLIEFNKIKAIAKFKGNPHYYVKKWFIENIITDTNILNDSDNEELENSEEYEVME